MADSHDLPSGPATPDEFAMSSPTSPGSIDDSSEASTPLDPPSSNSDAPPAVFSPSLGGDVPRRVPSLRTVSDPQHSSHMSPSSSVTGILNNARRPPPSANNLPLDIMAKARALQAQRMGMGPRAPRGLTRPVPPGFPKSAPAVPGAVKKPPSLSERRAMKLSGMGAPGSPATPATPKLSDMNGAETPQRPSLGNEQHSSKLSDFKNYIDADKGWITFEGAATITRNGVNFADGHAFSISLDEIDVLDELGKGNYGTVYKVRHARPKAPRFGQGLSGFRAPSRQASLSSNADDDEVDSASATTAAGNDRKTTTGVVMAMKEIRLELDEAKFTTILKELVILHQCVSPYIIDFYGAFYQEGAVYMCIEYMDGGSIDQVYVGGIPENVLRKITFATIMGLKTLKDDHNIIHRDVKPTNILVNTNGQVKICDFGVSGNLVASIAKTNIGCQSYMAPERISGGAMAAGGATDGTYNVQSDIWSLGLTVIECAMGRYPYPPEVSSTIFSQLSAIVEGDPPDLPSEGYSAAAKDFVRSCLNKIPTKRHTYPMLLQHPWIKSLSKPETITEDAEAEDAAEIDDLVDATGSLSITTPLGIIGGDPEVAEWLNGVLDRKKAGLLGGSSNKPALHAAPLDTVPSPAGSPMAV
ncbi:PaMKK3 MAPK kinase encoded by the PaMKK3 protein [Cladorrhinum sp. PSN259]|nr:PaMKK3 MAPK kinase encoded by the PaMKK3 protein [Cladorrhinum sp. PSN259]